MMGLEKTMISIGFVDESLIDIEWMGENFERAFFNAFSLINRSDLWNFYVLFHS